VKNNGPVLEVELPGSDRAAPSALWGSRVHDLVRMLAPVVAAAVLLSGGCAPLVVDLYDPSWAPTQVPTRFDDRDFATVLRENVKGGLVDYEHLAAHRAPLERFLGTLAVLGPQSTPGLFVSRSSRLAYYLNAYNAGVLQAVLSQSVPETMHDVRLRPFGQSYRLMLDGRWQTLAEIRESARRESNDDVRIEFAMCDAARGAPPLLDQPYRPDTLHRQLRRVAQDAMDNEAMVRIDHENQRLLLGAVIFLHRDAFIAYYAQQTGARTGSILDALLQLASGVRREWLNTAVGYDVGVIPFNRELNRWTPGTQTAG
jgi:hypothetical protein